jgi:hypothetical protein
MSQTNITSDNSGNQIKHSNPAVLPSAPSVGQPLVVTTAGTSAKPIVHGTIAGVVFDQPA